MKIPKFVVLCLMIFAIFCRAANAQENQPAKSEDRAAIRQAALDYIEGWYEGDATRMERALHPELAKRMVSTDSKTGKSVLNQMGAMTLVQKTRNGSGTHFTKAQRLEDVTILDVYRNAASVRIDAATWIDYLQLVKWNGDWKIVNVLWELKPETSAPEKSK